MILVSGIATHVWKIDASVLKSYHRENSVPELQEVSKLLERSEEESLADDSEVSRASAANVGNVTAGDEYEPRSDVPMQIACVSVLDAYRDVHGYSKGAGAF